MFQASRPSPTSTTRMVLALAAAAALAAVPVASATASPVPEPSTHQTVQPTQSGWQDIMTEIAAQARSTSSFAVRQMLHSELTIVMHSHRDW
ncbi:MAG: hypothetical protein ABI692_06975 [Terracoccus sp.]